MSRRQISGWVPAEVAERLSDVRHVEADPFCEYDEEHLKAILPDRLVAPIRSLMQTRMEMKCATGIGGLNKERALEHLQKDADLIYEALEMIWSEEL